MNASKIDMKRMANNDIPRKKGNTSIGLDENSRIFEKNS
jgi:hypothetical protein